MKLKITEASSRQSAASGRRVFGFRFPVSGLPRAQSAMALVITLIMLSVTLVMAIAFLAVARRERISVSTSTDTTVARLASDTALAAAQAQILANILATNVALYNYNLLVSTNYVNTNGFDNVTALFLNSPNNVSYYYPNGNLVAGADFDQNVANLMFLPRAPVLVSPAEPAGRFYLDLNRNNAFENTGWVTNLDSTGNGIFDSTINSYNIFQPAGDPQWVGILEKPGTHHAADNQFVSRYAFIAQPIGESLDLNYLHNQTVTEQVNPNSGGNDGFMRNQSVGSWEINLAAFLADLNTNQWLPTVAPANVYYAYNQPFGINRGLAFDDARALLSYRYNYFYNNLYSASQLFLSPNFNYLKFDNVDIYSDGPLQITTTNIFEGLQDPVTYSWPGSDNPNRFYTLADFYDPAKSSGGVNSFTNRLLNAGTTTAANGAQPTYDRYTYYRMLDQLGTESLPANAGKLNLNYQNAVVIYSTNGNNAGQYYSTTVIPGAETNLTPWDPRDFFCAAADAMLKLYTTNWFQADPSNFLATYYGIAPNFANYYYHDRFGNVVTNDPTGFGLTNIPFYGMTNQVPAFGLANIPVQVNGSFVYSPAVNRLLQMAANFFDAGTNSSVAGGVDYPHVFRPIFYRNPATLDVFVVGYTNVDSVPGGINYSQLKTVYDMTAVVNGSVPMANGYFTENVYGVPWIIGAKKYMPNFNEFYSFNTLQVSRKLQFNRKSGLTTWSGASKSLFTTNQMLVMSITNHIGFSFWNSYVSQYPGIQPVVYASDFIRMRLSYGSYTYTAFTNFTFISQPNPWPGSAWDTNSPPRKFNNANSIISGNFNFPFISESAINLDNLGNVGGFTTEAFNTNVTAIYPFPSFEQDTTNWFQAFILDNGHVLDYVQFAGPIQVRNLGDDLKDPDFLGLGGNAATYMWSTNASGNLRDGINWGVQHQIDVSKSGNVPNNLWSHPPNMPAGLTGIKGAEAAMFGGFFTTTWFYTNSIGVQKTYLNTNLQQQAPYTPTRIVVSPTLWVVNDPLVHYLSSDLNQPVSELNNVTNGVAKSDDLSQPVPIPSLASVQSRYQPWGKNTEMEGLPGVLHDAENASYNLAYRDPLVYGSDNWDFSLNKYPSVGWLGRVHRGTPWQTVYLKATNLLEFVDQAQSNPYVGKTTWKYWTGDFNDFDSLNSRPIQDELLFDIFTAAPNDNASRGALSVNQKHLAAWSAVLGGLLTISNITPNPTYSAMPIQTNVVIDPAGVDQGNSPLYQIVNGANGINATRGNLYQNGGFPHTGDILRTPALTQLSPFLNTSGSAQLQYDVSDEMYEWLPQQLMSLVRPSGVPRYVVYAYGQTLKPAPDGTVLSSSTLPGGYNPFGLVTNYQVVAESATRSVVTVQPVLTNAVVFVNGQPTTVPVTNYTTKVESFNVLPPQ